MAYQEYRHSRNQAFPPVVKNILIINGLVLLAQFLFDKGNLENVGNGTVMNNFALHYVQADLFKPWQIITHMFMHGGLWHLLLNMYAVWMFGSKLENLWGGKKFLIFYLVCGIGAAGLHMLSLWVEAKPMLDAVIAFRANPNIDHFVGIYKVKFGAINPGYYADIINFANQLKAQEPLSSEMTTELVKLSSEYKQACISQPTVGASGAVFGILAGFAYLFPNTELYLYGGIPIKAKWFVLGYAAVELYMAFRNSAGDNVAHWAHLGGALFGFILVYIWNKTDRKTFY
jgi:membrane associated rhomboid family serine protease